MTQVGDEVQLVVFHVGGAEFAFNIFQVERVLRYQSPEPLPGAPAFLEGVLPYGDAVVPVVDLRKRIGAAALTEDDTRIVVVDLEQGRVGVVVDGAREVLRVGAERVSPPPTLVQGLAAAYISGIVRIDQRTVVVLAPAKLLTSTEQVVLAELLAETQG
jgi:purine-binding chemotaxis protein CheW